jgi:hypothetical protein
LRKGRSLLDAGRGPCNPVEFVTLPS